MKSLCIWNLPSKHGLVSPAAQQADRDHNGGIQKQILTLTLFYNNNNNDRALDNLGVIPSFLVYIPPPEGSHQKPIYKITIFLIVFSPTSRIISCQFSAG